MMNYIKKHLTELKYRVLIKSTVFSKEKIGETMARLIDIDELADYLRLKKQTIYNWLNQGKISGIKMGGVWRFDRKDINSWIKSRKRLTRTGDKQ